MNAKDIARQRSALSKRVKALKDLYASDDLTTEDYQREMIAVQEHKRRLRRAEKKLKSVETPNLPAVIEGRQGSKRGREKRSFPPKEGRDEFGNSTNKETVAQYDSLLADKPERRCKGTNAQGEQCRNFAIKGGKVCKFHGGATRHVKEAARIRVEMASDRLMGKLIEIAYDDNRPASVQLDAIKDSLNRAGLTKPTQIEVGPTPHEEIFDDIFSGTRAESRRARGIEELSDSIGEQSFTEIGGYSTTAPAASADPGQSEPERHQRRRDCEPPAAPHADERRRRVSVQPQAPIITGEDAIYAANAANGLIDPERYGLPFGRSAYR
ncbi:hypothetical protein PDG61_08755 [Mycolicibacterium sp. BiH015]|uniref:hypothetical protein n=1 Tax=Mycolicibacterium sp. BiH015 TaxID=3018808 RepID=UPI0022DFB225|nr:hypothetical protein [Mycolicibacterium sp. BiH015]MDA2890998.1 hypothetical protein [Mycolicibacterium sp. BiH015]